MANSRKQEFNEDRGEQSNVNDFDDSSSISSAGGTSTAGSGRVSAERSEPSEAGLTERLTDILVDQGDGDLLLQRNDREDRVLQWLQALDMQVMGACRADERLKPLLKLNASSGVAEDRLLAHLSQHFEPSEVGMLARCFCIPLVSIRVGKINKQGTLLCPTTIRGDLNLTLLPASGLRLSFIGDDGSTERLFTLSSKTHCPSVEVHEIPADSSGRSFNLKISDGRVFYFWCSEKSKLLGIELLAKMKDILKRKPSIADLTGISKSRLDCFATHLRAYLVGSNGSEISACSLATSSTTPDVSDSTSTTKSLRSRHTGSLAVKTNSAYQGSLSPRSSSFKEGLPRSLSSSRNATREKLRRRVDNHLSAVDNIMAALPLSIDVTCIQSGNEKLQEAKSCPLAPSSVLESLGKLSLPPIQLPVSHVLSSSPPIFSPYYCWCPQGTSSLQYPSTTSEISTSSVESPLLPPLPPLLSASRPSNLLSPLPPLSLADFPSLDFPALLPDPLLRLPIPSSQQIPTFTPLMCDPIVHIPLIDVCSSGQGYLVSAGPTIASVIPPLHSRLVNPLIPETADSVVEKGARETLRLLISSSSQTNSQFMNVLPVVLTNTDQTSILASGSWSLFSGTRDVDAIANRIASMGLVSLSESSLGNSVAEISGGCESTNALPDNLPDGSTVLGGPYSDDEGTMFSNARKGTN